MINKYWINITVLIGAIFCITASAKTGNFMLKSEPKLVNSAYMDLMLEERRFPEAQRGKKEGGGGR